MDDFDRYLEKRTAGDADFRRTWSNAAADFSLRKAIIGARLKSGLEQAELANRIRTTESAIKGIEVGASRPRLGTLLKMAGALKVTFELDSAGIKVRPTT